MTVASKLFFHYRPLSSGRNATGNSDPDPDPDPDLLDHRYPRNGRHHRRHHHQHPSDLHGGIHRLPRLEHETVRLERRNSGKFEASKSSMGVSVNGVGRSKLIKHVQLPDAVMQARARLLERLRGLSLEESRQTTTVASISWDEYVVSNYTNADNFEDLEVVTPRNLSEPNTSQIQFSLHQPKKKLSSLSWEALCTQQRQVFSDSEESEVNKESSECYICLETFRKGDALIRLHCGHRFHPSCLQPWVQICGDCPCCRANVC